MAPTDLPDRRWPFVLGVAAFALAMTIGPIIATSGIDAGGSGERYAAGNAGMAVARAGVRSTLPGAATVVPAAVAAPPSAVTAAEDDPEITAPATTTPAEAAQAPDDDAPAPAEVPPDDGSVAVALEIEPPQLADGDTATWTVTVTNDGDEYLWGIYAYLEDLGPVACDARQLDIGASTTCVTEGPVWVGPQQAVAWVTAWTALRMVEADTSLPYTVWP